MCITGTDTWLIVDFSFYHSCEAPVSNSHSYYRSIQGFSSRYAWGSRCFGSDRDVEQELAIVVPTVDAS
ncbi:MAG: hypothetical protein JO266_13585 [Acidobacteria bacterium]|nr:hypothetical protein [Acidobacteriota bacterium]